MGEGETSQARVARAALGACVAGLAVVQIAVTWSGALGTRLGHGTALAIALCSAVAAAWLARTWWRNGPITTADRADPAPGRDPWHWTARAIAVVTVGWAASMFVRLIALARARPVYDWDGLYYHLPALAAWVEKGRVAWIAGSGDIPFVNYPMGVEALTFFLHRLSAALAIVTAGNLWFWPLGFFAVAVLAARLGATWPWPWWAAALIAGVPVVVCQSVTCYTDPAFAFTVMASLAAALLFVFDRERPALAHTALLGGSLGLMLGAKGGGAPFALVLLVATAVAALLAHRKSGLVATALGLAGAAVLAFAVGGYWYLRNAIHTGNPLHPIEIKIGALVLATGYDHVAFSEANLPPWLREHPAWLRMPLAWLEHDAPIHGYAPVGGLGFLWVGFALPAIAWVTAAGRRLGAARRPFALLAALVVMLLVVQTSPWWSRFTIWLHALGLPALAIAASAGARARRTWVRALALVAVVAATSVAIWECERSLSLEHATGRDDGGYRTTADAFFPGLAESPAFADMMAAPRVARSEWSRLGTLLGGVLAQPLGAREVVRMESAELRRPAALAERGIEWLVWDEAAAGPVPGFLAAHAVERGRWSPAGSDAGFTMMRIAAGRRVVADSTSAAPDSGAAQAPR